MKTENRAHRNIVHQNTAHRNTAHQNIAQKTHKKDECSPSSQSTTTGIPEVIPGTLESRKSTPISSGNPLHLNDPKKMAKSLHL